MDDSRDWLLAVAVFLGMVLIIAPAAFYAIRRQIREDKAYLDYIRSKRDYLNRH